MTPADEPSVAPFSNRFLLVTVAFRRLVQIRAGARARVNVASRKPTVLAVAEVIAGCIPWSADEADEAAPPADKKPSPERDRVVG